MDELNKFVTHKERLAEAEANMYVAWVDYCENKGSRNVDMFWESFESRRTAYRAVRDEFKGE